SSFLLPVGSRQPKRNLAEIARLRTERAGVLERSYSMGDQRATGPSSATLRGTGRPTKAAPRSDRMNATHEEIDTGVESNAHETTIQAPKPKKRGGGPRTPEGKDRSRRNALKHGLRAEVVLPDDLVPIVAERLKRFARELVPTNLDEEM